MAEPTSQLRTIERLASLALILEGALWLRVAAAVVVQWYAQRKGELCLFPDTNIYWALAWTIVENEPFEVTMWGNLPHFALRTPGYPLFLAVCQLVFGNRLLPVRLAQAVLGALSVGLVYRLTARLAPARPGQTGWTVPLIAAALAAIDPYLVLTSALVLSEALFLPLMLFALWGLAVLWTTDDLEPKRAWLWALGVGLASGAAIQVRPSWALLVPAILFVWVVASRRGRRGAAIRGALIVVLGVVVVMAPWWARNARIYGRFVPTALWMGASLYDGLNPRATGASDMEFLNAPEIRVLGEEDQETVLRDRALAFVAAQPGRAAWLAVVKFGRYWSPWPNARGLTSPMISLVSAAWTLPQFALLALGLWDRRRDPRALALMAGPLLYFCVLHMIFAGSMRYRIPAMMPAMGLVAIGMERITRRLLHNDSPRNKGNSSTDGHR